MDDIGDEDDSHGIGMYLKGIKTVHKKTFTTFQPEQTLGKDIIISSSGLNMVKSFFRYMELMLTLPLSSFDLFLTLTQNAELYAFKIFNNFVKTESLQKLFDERLGEVAHWARTESSEEVLKNISNVYPTFQFQKKYTVEVNMKGSELKFSVNNQLLFRGEDASFSWGALGVRTDMMNAYVRNIRVSEAD